MGATPACPAATSSVETALLCDGGECLTQWMNLRLGKQECGNLEMWRGLAHSKDLGSNMKLQVQSQCIRARSESCGLQPRVPID
jgi:hypothetical protein